METMKAGTKAEEWTDLERRAHLMLVMKELSTKGLAEELGVSTMTAARTVASLRKKGVKIVAVREQDRWHYQVADRKERARARLDSLRQFAESIGKKAKPSRLKPEDEAIYGFGED